VEEITTVGSSFSSFFLAASSGFPVAAVDDDDAGVEMPGLTAWASVETEVLTTDELAAVVDGGLVALPGWPAAGNMTLGDVT